MKCIYSHDDGAYCDKHDHGAVTVGCCGEDRCPDRKVLSNADRIRAMTDEELETWLVNLCCATTGDAANARVQILRGNLLDWLKQEASE